MTSCKKAEAQVTRAAAAAAAAAAAKKASQLESTSNSNTEAVDMSNNDDADIVDDDIVMHDDDITGNAPIADNPSAANTNTQQPAVNDNSEMKLSKKRSLENCDATANDASNKVVRVIRTSKKLNKD